MEETIYVIMCSSAGNLFAWEAHHDRPAALKRQAELYEKNPRSSFDILKTKLISPPVLFPGI